MKQRMQIRHNEFQKEYSELEVTIKEKTLWNKARVYVIVGMVMGLIRLRTVNLTRLSIILNPMVSAQTNYRRYQKFFLQFVPDGKSVAMLLSSFLPEGKWVVSMDRTNWKLGERDINILMIAVAYKGMAIPLIWSLLPKRGNSNSDERILLMEKFVQWFGSDRIETFVADREFIGSLWLDWFITRKISFAIRVKKDMLLRKSPSDTGKQVHHFFHHLKLYESYVLLERYYAYGHYLHIAAVRGKEEESLILLTNMENPNKAIEAYRKRWEIETLFGAFKSRGFNLEDTHMSDPKKIATLVAIISIAFVWAYKIGEWIVDNIKPIKIKKHQRKAQSLFRVGLDFLADTLLNLPFRRKELKWAINFLACT